MDAAPSTPPARLAERPTPRGYLVGFARDGMRIALLCWAVPLVAGVASYLLWLATNSRVWELVGTWALVLGTLAFFLGAAALFVSTLHAFDRPDRSNARAVGANLAALALLGSNFAVAGWIVDAVIDEQLGWMDAYEVLVENRSAHPLEDVRLSGACEQRIGDVAPRESSFHSFELEEDGAIRFHARWNGESLDRVLFEDASEDRGEAGSVIVFRDGTVHVDSRRVID